MKNPHKTNLDLDLELAVVRVVQVKTVLDLQRLACSNMALQKGIGQGNGVKCHHCKLEGHPKYNCPNHYGSQLPTCPRAKIASTNQLLDVIGVATHLTHLPWSGLEEHSKLQQLLTFQKTTPSPQTNSAHLESRDKPTDWHWFNQEAFTVYP
ncbi:hypothetical protein E3N88_45845 [Mikania micrantha]|uniref:CCHC-type domain-containing protein n=1 Tax=Mikania micrantha TaxID=192012 RepID=A0A5N6L896_9ASTR|nr:hypothetical protein E3N88_45845 [Mikania micrantha]